MDPFSIELNYYYCWWWGLLHLISLKKKKKYLEVLGWYCQRNKIVLCVPLPCPCPSSLLKIFSSVCDLVWLCIWICGDIKSNLGYRSTLKSIVTKGESKFAFKHFPILSHLLILTLQIDDEDYNKFMNYILFGVDFIFWFHSSKCSLLSTIGYLLIIIIS